MECNDAGTGDLVAGGGGCEDFPGNGVALLPDVQLAITSVWLSASYIHNIVG
jgi:hypothetical protein